MGELLGHSRPAHIVGEVIFTSYDGLRAEANGVLDFLTFDQRLLEMRSADILSTLPAYSTGNYGIILQQAVIDQIPYCIIGAVRKIQDFNKRPGILGSAVCMKRDTMSLEGVDTYLFDVLQSQVDDTFEEVWRSKPLPRKLNVLSNVPQREVHREARSNPNTELASLGNDINLASAIEGAMTFMRASGSVGRTILLMRETENTRVYDEARLAAIAQKAQHAEAERHARAHQIREEKEAEQRRLKQEHEQAELQRQRRASAAIHQFDNRITALEGRVDLSTFVSEQAETNLEEQGPAPQSLEEMVAALRNLQGRIVAVEKAVIDGRKRTPSKILPIDKAMQAKSVLTPAHEKLLVYGSIALGVLAILAGLLIFIFSVSEGNDARRQAVPAAVEQTAPAQDQAAPQTQQFAPLTSTPPSSRPEKPVFTGQPTSAPVEEDCEAFPDFASQTKCEKRREETQ